MHYSRHRAASVAYVTRLLSRTRQPMTNGLAVALLTRWSARQKINRVSSVQTRLSYVALYAP